MKLIKGVSRRRAEGLVGVQRKERLLPARNVENSIGESASWVARHATSVVTPTTNLLNAKRKFLMWSLRATRFQQS